MSFPPTISTFRRLFWHPWPNWVFACFQVVFFALSIWYHFRLPAPGYAVAFLAFAAAVMSLHAQMGPWPKAIWLIIMGLFLWAELRAITEDRSLAAQEQAKVLREQNEQFQKLLKSQQDGFTATVSGLTSVVTTGQQNFDQTMNRTDAILKKTQQAATLAQISVDDITGGSSYAYVTPQTGLDDIPIPCIAFNAGDNILSGVTISIRKGLVETDNPSPWGDLDGPQYFIGTLAPKELRRIPFKVTPHLGGKSGRDVYDITISAQNFSVEEQLSFRKGTEHIYAYKEQVTRSVAISKVGNTTKFRTDILLDRDWSDGPKEKP
jgi:hypothetical protein